MTEREAFEAQVTAHVAGRPGCGSPLDYALLGAYADWLDERGLDPDLARGLRSGHCPSFIGFRVKGTCEWYTSKFFKVPGHLDDLPDPVYRRLRKTSRRDVLDAFRDLGAALADPAVKPRRRRASPTA